jgi:hypothetical protein
LAADPPYLEEMPTVERVRADVQGTDRYDTLARQKAAFEQLFRGLGLVAGPRQYSAGFTPDEQRWRNAYRGAADAARDEAYAELSKERPKGMNPFAKSPLQSWNSLEYGYERGSDPLKLRAGFRSHRLGWATGRVADYKTWITVEVINYKEVTTNQYGVILSERWVGSRRREYEHETFSIESDGGTHLVHVVDAGLKFPEGNVATAVWAKKGSDSGSYVLFFDRTASRTLPMLSTVAALLKVGRLMYLPVLALALLIGGAVASGAGGASATLGVLIGLFVGFIVGAALFRRIAARRARRFAAEAPRVLAAIAEGESSAAAAVTQAA